MTVHGSQYISLEITSEYEDAYGSPPKKKKEIKEWGKQTVLENMETGHNRNLEDLGNFPSLQSLDLSKQQIGALYGIEKLTGLKRVTLSRNQIIDLKPLSGLKGISSLHLDSNQITDVKAIKDLEELFF